MSAFATLLEAHFREGQGKALQQRWLSRLAETPRPDGSSHAHLEARLPLVLRALIGALRGEPVQAPRLQHFGLDARAEVYEYGVLGEVLVELAAEADLALSPAELRVFTRFVSALTCDVVDAHALRRVERDRAAEAATRAQTAEALSGAPDAVRRRPKLFEMIVAGNWALDVVTQMVIADPSLLALHQLPASAPVSLEALRAGVHPDDRDELSALVTAALNPQGSGQYLMQYRVAAGPGQYRWIQTFGQTLFEHGVPRQIVGTAIEITQRKEAELARDGLVRALEEQPLVQVMVLEGPNQIVTMMNAEYRKNVAGGRHLLGIPVLEAFPHLANQGFSELMKGVLTSGKPFVVRDLLTPVDLGSGALEERYFDFVVQPVRGRSGQFDTLLNLSIDVTASVEARRSLEAIASAAGVE